LFKGIEKYCTTILSSRTIFFLFSKSLYWSEINGYCSEYKLRKRRN